MILTLYNIFFSKFNTCDQENKKMDDSIAKIKDNHKRAFALGFKFLFEQQDTMHRSAIANAANVPPAAITCIMHGYEERFPSFKAQTRISKVFNTDVYTIVRLGQKIQAGYHVNTESYNEFKNKTPKHSNHKAQEVIERFKLNYSDNGLNRLSKFEQQLLKLCRSFNNDKELLQVLYDFACDQFISYQSRTLTKIRKN